jgi:phosphonatase-like hydrolase
MNDIALVIFDLAGTTVKDGGQVAKAFSAALAEHRVEITPEQLAGVRGASKRQAIFELIPAGADREICAGRAYESFRENLSRQLQSEGVESIEGAGMVFEKLRERGIRLAANTGFDRDITELLLTALNWRDGIFDAVICGDDVARGRPAPDLILQAMKATRTKETDRVANVGDTVLDLQAAHSAGVAWNIGVLSGAHDRERLQKAPHTHILNSIADLPDLFR